MEDVIVDCAKLIKKCETCGEPLDWDGDFYGCLKCREAEK